MHVGVLGGGLQGCCVALALAERGLRVTLFDKNSAILSRTAVANEGKIHLGYMYAGDPTFGTAKLMMMGALSFALFFERYLGCPPGSFAISQPATYVIHRDSQVDTEASVAYLNTVHALIMERVASFGRDVYFGFDLRGSLRRWSSSEIQFKYDPTIALAAVSTQEVAIDPVALARTIGNSIKLHPLIEVCCNHTVTAAKDDCETVCVVANEQGKSSEHRFDHVVNALWDGRLQLDQTIGYRPSRPWLHRLKYGVSFRLPEGATAPPSTTFILGPFGEVVTYGDRRVYLTWYPNCLQAISKDLQPPHWDIYPSEPLRSRIIKETFHALASIVPSLGDVNAETLPEASVKGGPIVAWGNTDIYDPTSELHRRFEIGVTSMGRFHSVDPGKLTMAPYFAEICADRIKPKLI